MSTTDTDQLEAQLRRQWSIPAGKSQRPLWPKENRAVQVQSSTKTGGGLRVSARSNLR